MRITDMLPRSLKKTPYVIEVLAEIQAHIEADRDPQNPSTSPKQGPSTEGIKVV